MGASAESASLAVHATTAIGIHSRSTFHKAKYDNQENYILDNFTQSGN